MRTISVNVPTPYLKDLENLVQQDLYANRSEAIRVAIRDLLNREKGEQQQHVREDQTTTT